MNLSIKDKKLLYQLDQNSRATNKDLGKKIGLSEQAIGYKLKKLEQEGIIKKYVTFVNTLALGYNHYKVLLRLQNVSPEKEKEIIDYMTKNKEIRWVISCSGKWDINLSILAQTPLDFIRIFREIENKYGNFIAEKNVAWLIKSPGFTRGYLIGQKNLKVLEYQTKKLEKNLDKKDMDILKSISQNARKNVVDIANEIKSSVDVVRYRLKSLEEEEIISGYTVQFGLEKLGILRYSIFFSLCNMNEEIENKMIAFAKHNNNIIFILSMIGTYDLSLELEITSYAELELIMKKFREQFSVYIKDFEIIFNTHEYKYDFYPF